MFQLDDFIIPDDDQDDVQPLEGDNVIDDDVNSDQEPNDDSLEIEEEEIISEGPDDDDSDAEAKAYFEFLKEYNIVPEDFEFDGSAESVEKALEATKGKLTKEVGSMLWNSLPEDFKPLLEYALAGGTSLESYLKAYSSLDYDTVDLEDPINQKRIIRDWYKQTTQHSDDKIERMIERLESRGDLEEEAESALEDLKTIKEQSKANLIKQAEEEKRQQEEYLKQQTELISNTIESSKFDSLRKARIKSFMLQPIQKDGETKTELVRSLDNITKNPEHLVQLANILADYDPRVGFNFDRIKKQISSEETVKFKDLMKAKLDSKTKVKTGVPKKSDSDNFDLSKWNI